MQKTKNRLLAAMLSAVMTLSIMPTTSVAAAESSLQTGQLKMQTTVDAVTITVTADKGIVPEGTEVIASELSKEEYSEYKEKAAENLESGETLKVIKVYDIEIVDANGDTVRPEGAVNVTFQNIDTYTDGEYADVYHFKNGDVDKMEVMDINTVGHDISFDVSSFSPFMIARTVQNTVKKSPRQSALTTIETVDSTSIGFDMWMFKFPLSSSFDPSKTLFDGSSRILKDNDGNVIGTYSSTATRGILNKTLGSDGYPVVSSTGESLSKYFSTTSSKYNATKVNHLFSQDYYEKTGYLYYNCMENYAYLQSDGNFKVYDVIGIPNWASVLNNDGSIKTDSDGNIVSTFNTNMRRGQFYPYNDLTTSTAAFTQTVAMSGKDLDDDSELKNQTLYIADGYAPHFGLYATAKFTQPANGKTENGNDMVFEFEGDDDLWVFIDDVLILDLGGIHDATHGYINFASGSVTFDNTETTIGSLFVEAGKRGEEKNWTGDRFANGTEHTMTIIYMERGEVCSDLMIKTNIETIPNFSATKKVYDETGTNNVENSLVKQGDTVTYEITIKNDDNRAKTYSVSDAIPSGMTFVSASDNGYVKNGTVYWDSVTVSKNSSKKITFKATTATGLTTDKKYENKATVSLGKYNISTNTVNIYTAAKSTKTVTILREWPEPKTLSLDREKVSKEGMILQDFLIEDGEYVNVGETITYHISWSNPSEKTQNLAFNDTLPAGLKYIDGSVKVKTDTGTASDTLSYKNGTISGTISAGAESKGEIAFQCIVTEDAVNAGRIKNIATINGDKPEVEVSVLSTPQKSVSGSDGETDSSFTKVGNRLTYTITFKNTAESAKWFDIYDIVPENVTVDESSISDDGVLIDGVVYWYKKLSAATSGKAVQGSVSFTVTVNEEAKGTTITNNATVLVDDIKQDTNEVSNPVIKTSKKVSGTNNVADGTWVKVGDKLTYSISYSNPYKNAKTVTITDTVPSNITVDESSISDNGKLENGVITWTLKDVAGKTSDASVSFTATVDEKAAGTLLTNKAKVSADKITVDTNEIKNPVIKATKNVLGSNGETDGTMTEAGNTLTYTIKVKNPDEKAGVFTIKDKVPANVTVDEESISDGGSIENGVITWSDINIASKAEKSVSFNVVIKKEAEGTILKNNAVITTGSFSYITNVIENPVLPAPVKSVMDEKGNDIDGLLVSKGSEMTYSIHVENPASESKVFTVTDTVPDNTEILSYSDGDSCSISNGTYTWTYTIKGGASHDFTFVVKPTAENIYLENQASVSVDNVLKKTNVTKNWVPESPVKSVVKDNKNVDGKVFFKGDESPLKLTYTIKVTNPSESKKTFTVTDILAEGADFASASDNGVYASGVVTWNVDVEAGKSKTLTLNITVDKDTEITKLENYANVSADNFSKTTNTVVNYITDRPEKNAVNGSSSTSSSKKLNGRVIFSGDEYTYTITWTNPTDETKKYTVTDKLPEGFEFESATEGGTENNGTITWKNIAVEAGESMTVSVTGTVMKGYERKELSNKANVAYSNGSGLYNRDTNTVNVYIGKIEKSVTDTKGGNSIYNKLVAPGQHFFYEIKVYNDSSKDQKMTVKDTVPAGLEVVDASDEGEISGTTVTWTNITIPEDGKKLYIEVVVSDVSGNTSSNKMLKNTATVKNGLTGSTITSNEARTYLLPAPIKSVSASSVKAGGEVVYTIRVENPAKDAKTFTVKDVIDSKLTVVGASDNASINGNAVVWNLTIGANTAKDVTVTVMANSVTDATTIDNTASVSADGASRDSNIVQLTVTAPEAAKTPENTNPTTNTTTDSGATDTTATSDGSTSTTIINWATGDSAVIMIWAFMAVICVAGIGIAVHKKRG